MITRKALALAQTSDLPPRRLRGEMKALSRKIGYIRWLAVWRVLVGGDPRYQAIYRRRLRALNRRLNEVGQAWTWHYWHHA
ncbi:MAG: hypothetical protein H6907_14765 [Hyphomicrobiales bacterium]|nr:hypothetical protein [Hyphomicrobiales bacterium]MCP5372986.1 hypothetical protein [Hyphomicrobiales bacterium]